ncbi:MAG: hypothetical protein AABY15_05405 [Nanoarchaeota archaeon]
MENQVPNNDEKILLNNLSIVKHHLEGRMPFKIEKVEYSDVIDKYVAVLNIGGKRFDAFNVNNKIFINKFPIKNIEDKGTYGYIGFPTDVSYALYKYNGEREKTPFEDMRLPGELNTIGMNEIRNIIREELKKTLNEQDFNYASAEREFHDKEQYAQDTQDEQMREAMISVALSFMQDVQGSANKLIGQTNLSGTNPEVDAHLGQAIEHINKAIEVYFDNITPEIKQDVVNRLGEVKTDE